ncbi:MAG: enoyl-CoA hydratase-related protein [Alphaproteobacteria bacterium]|jgi:enoyl-CoA hydratase/carnithine racemase|nr:enoyl-CoA hydratase-related protein [Alphaproteobacteria bacterium]MDP6564643.1 enoyl-CoA hydratase-related protein [Alphaproteobacteria bacterium]MDP6815492.1 enoyl-CoA hydratase-related protein [Alphaproteobacteria bacterium]
MPKVLYEKSDKIAYVTLNRPEAMNAVDLEMHDLLWETWKDFAADDDLELAIVTGAGNEAFCAGADLKSHLPYWLGKDTSAYPRDKIKDGFGGITRGLHRIYKPIIAAVNGWAVAGGLETALACDIRIASENAMFGSFEVRRGYHHGDGGIVRMVNTCGAGIALEMNLTGEPIDAQRALQCNLVSKVVPRDQLMTAAEDMAAKILRNDAWAIRSAKETILNVIGRPLDDQLAYEAITGYSGLSNPAVPGLLRNFADKTDKGRAGRNTTDL